MAELSAQEQAQTAAVESRQPKSQHSGSSKHKKQKTVTGAASFSAEEVAHRKQKWEARQGTKGMESLKHVRQSLPIAALRSVYSFSLVEKSAKSKSTRNHC